MLTKNNAFKCDECGKFIPTDDLLTEKAIHRLEEPDSDLGVEKWTTVCKSCMTEGGLANDHARRTDISA